MAEEVIVAGSGYKEGATEMERGKRGKFFGVVVENCVVNVAAESKGKVTEGWNDGGDCSKFVGFNLCSYVSMRCLRLIVS